MRSASDNLRFFEDMAKMAGGARGHVKTLVAGFLGEMDLVTREELERVEALAQKARTRQLALEKRLEALEKKLKLSAKRSTKK